MRCDIGNAYAIEGYRPDPASDKVVYRTLDGEQVTSFVFPEGMAIDEAVSAVQVTMGNHMQSGATPSWVESDTPALKVYLSALWGLSQDHERPGTWGSPKDATGNLTKGTAKTKKAGAPAPLPKITEEQA